MYEQGKTYLLSFPTNGMNIETRQVARYPIGLPVKFIKEQPEYVICVEPHGEPVAFPKTPSWETREIDLFNIEIIDPERPTLVENSQADQRWEIFTQPHGYRWYIDVLRNKYTTAYADWEMGFHHDGIRYILEAAQVMLSGDDQDFVNAVCDLALLFYEDDSPGWYRETPREVARQGAFSTVQTIYDMLTLHYTVKTGGDWKLEEGKFKLEDLEVCVDDWGKEPGEGNEDEGDSEL